jgi:hypothetical protein
MRIEVHCEWPSGSETVEFDLDDDSTPEQIAQSAEEAFFSKCNFGYSIDGEAQ